MLPTAFQLRDSSPEQTILRQAAAIAVRTIPTTQSAAGFSADGAQSLFFEGPIYHGKPTRVFAWYGFPANTKQGEKVSAMVLIHGGGGTAFSEWVQLWNKKGYAAIAIDTCGCVPIGADDNWQRDERGGPPRMGRFAEIDQPASDQWMYHAVLDVILANSLVRSWPQVDADRVGVTGISWGGYLTCIAAGLDNRFKFACPVYACGFLGDNSAWLDELKNLGPQRREKWLKAWDPSEYLPDAKMPMLWVTGTNDGFYPPDSLRKSYCLPAGPRTLVIRVGMQHGHEHGWAPEEISAFADALCLNGLPLATIQSQGISANTTWVMYNTSCPIEKAELNFTLDHGQWKDRQWQTQPAAVSAVDNKVQATLPTGATAHYINLIDARGRIVSTDLTIA